MITHRIFEHGKDCPSPGECDYCDGGLEVCTVCKGFESSLATECPGVKLTKKQDNQVSNSILDYKNGQWVKLS